MFAYDLPSSWANPIWFVVLEPIRGVWLYAVSRRY